MNDATAIPDLTGLKEGERRVCEVEGRELLVVRDGGRLHVFENRCPHRGARLSGGVIRNGCLTCPWHGARFDLQTGESSTHAGLRLSLWKAVEREGQVCGELAGKPSRDSLEGIQFALVRYGVTGQVGWFGTIEPLSLHRGGQVVVETPLGKMLGEVLVLREESLEPPPRSELRGELLRLASGEDVQLQMDAARFCTEQFTAVEKRLADAGHTAVEVEAALDRRSVVIWLLTEPDEGLGRASVELAAQLRVDRVQFMQRSESEAPAALTGRYNGDVPSKPKRQEGNRMKGPGLREKHDLDRVWECAVCRHRERTNGLRTSVPCPVCAKTDPPGRTTFLKLVSSPATAPRKSFTVVSSTPVPVPVASILGEDTTRVPRKQALRPAEAAPEGEAASPQEIEPSTEKEIDEQTPPDDAEA